MSDTLNKAEVRAALIEAITAALKAQVRLDAELVTKVEKFVDVVVEDYGPKE